MKKRTFLLILLILLATLIFGNGAHASAATQDVNKKPSFTANAVVSGDTVTINVNNGININHVNILDINGKLIGDMTGGGSDWVYVMHNLPNGDYSYRVVASSLASDKIIKNQSQAKANTAERVVSAKVTGNVSIKKAQYGTSGEGRPLYVVSIEPAVVTSKILVVFEIHGYEDAYPKDGWSLVNSGNELIDYFSAHPEQLNGKALYVVASANPDGLADGWTNNGPGRCQLSGGVDINRDFDYYWQARYDGRNKTLSPFSAPETCALRDLVMTVRPTYVFDVHGWLACTFGTPSLVKCFNDALGISRDKSVIGASGHFAGWAYGSGYCQDAALIELPSPYTDPQCLVNGFVNFCKSY